MKRWKEAVLQAVRRVEPYPGRWAHLVVLRREGEVHRELLGWIQEAAAFSAGKRQAENLKEGGGAGARAARFFIWLLLM